MFTLRGCEKAQLRNSKFLYPHPVFLWDPGWNSWPNCQLYVNGSLLTQMCAYLSLCKLNTQVKWFHYIRTSRCSGSGHLTLTMISIFILRSLSWRNGITDMQFFLSSHLNPLSDILKWFLPASFFSEVNRYLSPVAQKRYLLLLNFLWSLHFFSLQ